ncbi:Threonine--tRNA ligase [Candidatus Cyrtobacter comes]|uniref:Threonine--tRNA ligase n=1 Tax=Candidatus Cyrtobacter comes TaxID=675776 RepID=A0ABU5L8W4_9RICK|nr:threonine--tRNA ligase [Candidatus Cyrtobacter comes]MDZ5762555.1 Threonine--tRNA ligase [Candidatus Cyrtobacter comes]
MIDIVLPSGEIRQFQSGVSGFDVASSISSSLLKNAIAVKIDGKLYDLSHTILHGCSLEVITQNSQEGLDIIRHSTAHLMAHAIKELFPNSQIVIGPTIEDGFYYDIAKSDPFSLDDLQIIEERMSEVAKRNYKIERTILPKKQAIEVFEKLGEHYKVKIIENIPDGEEVTLYSQGNFIDLCRGPHVPSTGHIKHFKLTKVSGSYWQGDSKNEGLHRIYGTAWQSASKLSEYLQMLKETELRDHRKIGKQMDLFHFQDDAPGTVFWHPNGWRVFQLLVSYMRKKQELAGYQEINTPDIMDKSIWEASGHWEKFKENMFTAHCIDVDKEYALKPMNCPGAVQVFNKGLKSYRDLPVKLSEFGKVHRFEPSGSLLGLMRVRGFTQDDAHIFCTEDHVQKESVDVCKLMLSIYKDFGFNNVRIKFSDRPSKRVGSDEIWLKSEEALLSALNELGLEYELNKGDGAFYGPKLEFVLKDAIGRDWQVGTLQIDFNLPERLDASYITDKGKKQRPVMLHRAMFGSLERFIGILIEHTAGHLPIWLSPIQVAVLPISSKFENYAAKVSSSLTKNGIRNILDSNNETISYKIKTHMGFKVPYLWIVGQKEVDGGLVSISKLGSEDKVIMGVDEAIASLYKQSFII